MAIRGDSYSSTTAVMAYTRHLLDGESAFNTTTRPTASEVEGFIDEASGVLNLALRDKGFSPANVRSNSTAKLACDAWVRAESTMFVELTQRGAGYGAEEGSRTAGFGKLFKRAQMFVKDHARGMKREGVTVSDATHQGMAFSGLTLQSDRSDPDNTGYEQPKFKRGLFDNG